ncbi:hypothetical protein AB0I82_35650 [Streptomyces sp. NPDC050315]|uniref:hypothetical protein n=1 Tax=Streptomyces sp. NPDC050315 TaxID=3155039 RepID=UPI00341FB26D
MPGAVDAARRQALAEAARPEAPAGAVQAACPEGPAAAPEAARPEALAQGRIRVETVSRKEPDS